MEKVLILGAAGQIGTELVNTLRATYGNDQVIAGFAGGTADAFTLFERFEAKLDQHQGNLTRAAVELAKDWRTDRMLRKLEALLAKTKDKFQMNVNGRPYDSLQYLIADTSDTENQDTKYKADLVKLNDKIILEKETCE